MSFSEKVDSLFNGEEVPLTNREYKSICRFIEEDYEGYELIHTFSDDWEYFKLVSA